MRLPFSFKGEIGRIPYAASALAAFFSQHLAVLILFNLRNQPLLIDGQFLLMPLRSPSWANMSGAPLSVPMFTLGAWWVPIFALPLTLVVAWVLAALSFRRAADSHTDPWIAAASIVPVVQLPAILFLCVVPSRKRDGGGTRENAPDTATWFVAAQGMLAGVTLSVFSVVLGALVFGVYGYGMFVLSPLMVGATTGYLANRQRDVGTGPTAALALGATALGGIALVVVALEGVLCLVLAFPLTVGLSLLGGMLGAAIAHYSRAAAFSLMSIALLPAAFGAEQAFPSVAQFESRHSIEIAASPERVWKSITEMEPIDSPPPVLFRLGVSYPIGGQFIGAGVGAIRRGVFSTGLATERVTEWVANERLVLEVTDNPPAMRELSPYEHVQAPHVSGYFETKSMSFEIHPHGNGVTVVERTTHELRLDPLWYWIPMARWIVEQNNSRVLMHIKRQAEHEAALRR